MLALIATAAVILVIIPACLLGLGKLIATSGNRLSRPEGGLPHAARPATNTYDTLHQRLNAASAANPLLPKMFNRS